MTESSWEDRLESFNTLEEGWDSYGGAAITKQAILSTREVIDILVGLGIPAPQPVPISTGGIALEWHTVSTEFSMEIGPHGDLDSVFVYGGHLNTFELARP